MITPHKMNFNKNRPGPNRLSVGRRFSWGLIFSPHYFLPLTIRDFGEKLVKVLFHHSHSEAEQTFACISSNCWREQRKYLTRLYRLQVMLITGLSIKLGHFRTSDCLSVPKSLIIPPTVKNGLTHAQEAQICTKCTYIIQTCSADAGNYYNVQTNTAQLTQHL